MNTNNTPEEDLIIMDALSLGLATPLDDAPDKFTVDLDALAELMGTQCNE